MSQLPTVPAPAPAPAGNSAKKPQSPVKLVMRISLLVLLAVLIVATGIDLMARRACQNNYEKIDEMVGSREIVSRKDVLETIEGGEPQFEQNDYYAVDTIHWRSGLPTRSYTISILYTKSLNGAGQIDKTKKGNESWDLDELKQNQKIDLPKPTP